MPVKYSDVDWNGNAVQWYITCRSIDLTVVDHVEKPVVHEADDEVQLICDDIHDDVSRLIGRPVADIEADSFAVKVAHSGLHFYIKARISTTEYAFLLVHRPYSYSDEKPKVEAVLPKQKKSTPLTYF